MTKTLIKGTNKTLIKGDKQNTHKRNNKKKKQKLKNSKQWRENKNSGATIKEEMTTLINNVHTREDKKKIKDKRRIRTNSYSKVFSQIWLMTF